MVLDTPWDGSNISVLVRETGPVSIVSWIRLPCGWLIITFCCDHESTTTLWSGVDVDDDSVSLVMGMF